jgi:hypothetical protein
MKVNSSIIRIIGLLGEIPEKSLNVLFTTFQNNGYNRELYPVDNEGNKDTRTIQFLRDYFYPGFRKVMFLQDKDNEILRCIKSDKIPVSIKYNNKGNIKIYPIQILKSEIYLFRQQIGLFSLSIEVADENKNLQDINNIISVIKNFDAELENGLLWHNWISKHLLCNIALRGTDKNTVAADEYSGSKFKVYSILDFEHNRNERNNFLYDMATASPLGTSLGNGFLAPNEDYFKYIIENRIALFTNWDAVCLFDSFCCIGENNIGDIGTISYKSWDYTYFRIYLYRLFFKYNLYRYNSMINEKNVKNSKLRDQFEEFLNKYNISHISFNFLGNELFNKTGKALELEQELTTFRERIKNISQTLQEQRQSKTNNLLQLVTLIGGISSISPIFIGIIKLEKYLAWNSIIFYGLISLISLILIGFIIYYIFPELFKKIWKKKTSNLE